MLIKDLEMTKELSREDLAAVRGGDARARARNEGYNDAYKEFRIDGSGGMGSPYLIVDASPQVYAPVAVATAWHF